MPLKFRDFFPTIFAFFILAVATILVYKNANNPIVLSDKDYNGFENVIENPVLVPPTDPTQENPELKMLRQDYNDASTNYSNSDNLTIINDRYEPAEIKTLVKTAYLTESRYRAIIASSYAQIQIINRLGVGNKDYSVVLKNLDKVSELTDEFKNLVDKMTKQNDDVKATSQLLLEKSAEIKTQLKNIIELVNTLTNDTNESR